MRNNNKNSQLRMQKMIYGMKKRYRNELIVFERFKQFQNLLMKQELDQMLMFFISKQLEQRMFMVDGQIWTPHQQLVNFY